MKRKSVIIGAVVLVAAVAGVVWLVHWARQPHSAQEQLHRARQAEKDLRAGEADLSPDERVAGREGLIELYEKVYRDFPDDGAHDDAKQRIAEICEELLEDRQRAARMYERLLQEHPDSDLAEEAVHRLVKLYKAMGIAVAGQDGETSLEWFHKAVDLLERFIADHPESGRIEDDMMEVARLWQDHIRDPLEESEKALDRYLKSYEKGRHAAEAHFRLGQWYEAIKERELALRQYTRVTKDFPDSEFVDRSLERLEELYAEKQGDKEKAADAARQIAARNPGTAKGARYAGRADSHEAEAIRQKDRRQEREYYGAPIVDVTVDKPLADKVHAQIIAQKLDTLSYTIDVRIDAKSGELRASGRMELVNGGEAREQVLLQLNGGMTLERVELDGAAAKVTSPSEPGREAVTLKLSKPWPAGSRVALTFDVAGTFRAPVPVPEGIDISGSDAPTPEQEKEILASLEGDVRVRIGDSGYAISGAAWYPLTVYGDMFTTDVTYRLPGEGYEVAATGRLEAPESSGETVRRYVSETPIFGLYFAYGKYVPVETAWSDGRTIVAYVPGDKQDLGARLGVMARDILAFYEPRFGKLKHPRLAISVSPLPVILGGIGPPGMMILADHFIGDAGPSVSLMAHELAHQWWGNVVPISFEKGYSLWLSEGFATYCDALYNEHLHGREFLVQHLRKYGVFYFEGSVRMPDTILRSVVECGPGNPMYRRTVYEKGALALHTLRYLLGDETFFETLRLYAQECEGRHSTVEDFRRVAEKAGGQDLGWFFEECLGRPGFPHYVITGLAPGGEGQYVLTVEQAGEPLWRFPLDVVFYSSEGQQHTVSKAKVDGKENRVTVRLPWEPVRAELDPEHWVFRHPGPDNLWPRPEPEAAPQPGAGGGSAEAGVISPSPVGE